MKHITGYFFTKKDATDFYLFSSSNSRRPRLLRYTFSRTTHSNLFLSKVKEVLLIPSKFKNALPSFLVQGFNLMTSLKIIMTSSLKTFSIIMA
jgi:hypothetical protein